MEEGEGVTLAEWETEKERWEVGVLPPRLEALSELLASELFVAVGGAVALAVDEVQALALARATGEGVSYTVMEREGTIMEGAGVLDGEGEVLGESEGVLDTEGEGLAMEALETLKVMEGCGVGVRDAKGDLEALGLTLSRAGAEGLGAEDWLPPLALGPLEMLAARWGDGEDWKEALGAAEMLGEERGVPVPAPPPPALEETLEI